LATLHDTYDCRDCGSTLPVSEFPKTNSRLGHRPNCKKCHGIEVSIRYHNNPGVKDMIRDRNLKRKFGISLNEYQDKFNSQSGLCQICNKEEPVKGRLLSVDHCHETGKIRGLLCTLCNTTLGKVKDDIDLLESMIQYLERYGD
jgi:hypothetical protein